MVACLFLFLCILSSLSLTNGNQGLPSRIPTPSPSTSPHVSALPTYTIVATPSTLPGMKEFSSPNQSLVISGAAAIGCIGLVLASACYFRHFKYMNGFDYATKRVQRNVENVPTAVTATDRTSVPPTSSLDNDRNRESSIDDYKKSLLANDYTVISDYAKLNEYELQPNPSKKSFMISPSSVFRQFSSSSSSFALLSHLPSYQRTLSVSSTNSVQEEMHNSIPDYPSILCTSTGSDQNMVPSLSTSSSSSSSSLHTPSTLHLPSATIPNTDSSNSNGSNSIDNSPAIPNPLTNDTPLSVTLLFPFSSSKYDPSNNPSPPSLFHE